ncbi:MAG: phosphatidate cytidylyltransferase [Treponema sp.]|nr:phosphatidate cytidylyltransferase [Treponema sp.]MDY5838664.1 phosphatidate cytidylyltransferase [Treponema sp.]
MRRRFSLAGRTRGIISRQRVLMIFKEAFRKAIHLCCAFVPFLLSANYPATMIVLLVLLTLYSVSEFIRLRGIHVPVISTITEAAARKRDENRFVLGPVTLVCGIFLCAFIWKSLPATIGIYALAFGDGLASLSGKMFGRVHIPFTGGKTVAGSLTCFTAIFISCFLACVAGDFPVGVDVCAVSLIIASVGMTIELLPLKDFDNILIPLVLGALSQFLLCL